MQHQVYRFNSTDVMCRFGPAALRHLLPDIELAHRHGVHGELHREGEEWGENLAVEILLPAMRWDKLNELIQLRFVKMRSTLLVQDGRNFILQSLGGGMD